MLHGSRAFNMSKASIQKSMFPRIGYLLEYVNGSVTIADKYFLVAQAMSYLHS